MSLIILMPITIFMTRFYHNLKYYSRIYTGEIIHTISLSIAVFLFILSSCEKDPTILGKEVLPGKDFFSIFSTDTISVMAYTEYNSSVLTSTPAYSYLGSIFDPYFGTTTAEFVTQLRLGQGWIEGEYTVDSVKLYMRLEAVTGISGDGHRLRLSEISEELSTDNEYYSDETISLTGYRIPDLLLPDLQLDTINNVSIDIPVEFGNYILRDTLMLFHDDDDPDFRSYFKGLYFQLISPEDKSVLLTLSLEPPASFGENVNYFIIFMHDEENNQLEYRLMMDAVQQNACFNRYIHNFNTAYPENKIRHINDGFRDTMTFLQGLEGVYTKIKLPGLSRMKEDPEFSKIMVNKARLICPVVFDGNLYKPSNFPRQLLLGYADTDGKREPVPDIQIGQTSGYGTINYEFFDGVIDSVAKVYKFNIATFVQGYLKDTSDVLKPELEIYLPSGMVRNAIFKANDSSTPMRLEFTFTKY